MSEFLFLVSTSKEGKGKQSEQELVRAVALSHAARVSHQKRKEKEASQLGGPKSVTIATGGRQRKSDKLSRTVVSRIQKRWEEEEEEEERVLVGPLTILKGGNSDPFRSLAIAVTPRVNEILSFFKNSFLPAIYQSDSETHYRSFSADSAWDIHRTTLYAECSAHSFVLIALTLMANVATCQALETEKLVVKGKLLKSLRVRIRDSAETDPAVLDSVMFLFAAEIFAGNFAHATMHGRTLRTLLHKKFHHSTPSSIGPIDQTILTHALYYDSHLSLSNMSLPIFALDQWVGEVLDPLFRPLNEYTKPLESLFVNDLDTSLDGDPLWATFVQVRLAIWLWTQPKPINDDGRSALSLWVMGQTHLCKAMLIKHYLDLRSILQPAGRDHPIDIVASVNDEDIHVITQACLTLGLLLFFMSFGGDPTIAGRPLLQIYKTLFTHLKAMISQAVTKFDVNSPLMLKYQNAHLWVLFLGAQAERGGRKSLLPNHPRGWFIVTFGSLARRMDLLTWEMVRVRLTYFCYSDAVEPHGSVWVPECLARAGESIEGGKPWVL